MRNHSVVRVPRFSSSQETSEALLPQSENDRKAVFKDRVMLIAAAADLSEEDLIRMEAEGNAIKERWRLHWATREAAVQDPGMSQSPSQD